MISRRRFLLGSAGVASLCLVGGPQQPVSAQGAPAGLPSATPLEALDGEKLRVVLNGERVVIRLIGCDAPEPEVKENTTECGFLESRQALFDAVNGKTLLLEADEEDKDRRERLWRHVWLVNPDGTDGGLLNEQLLLHGWVTTQEEKKNIKYADRYATAFAEAGKNKPNLYTTCKSFHEEIPRHGGHDDPAFVGETIQVKGIQATLNSFYYSYTDHLGTNPKGGFMFLIISVTIVNGRESGKFLANSSKFAAKDLVTAADYDDEFAFLNLPLETTELSPGEYVTGEVALEVQETATNVRLKFNVEDDYSLYWLTPVG